MFDIGKQGLPIVGIMGLLIACGSPTPTEPPQPTAPAAKTTPTSTQTRPAAKTASAVEWASTLPAGSALRAAVLDREGDIILAPTMSRQGEFAKHPLAQGLTLLALKSSGQLRWQRHVSDSLESLVRAIVETEDGDYIVAGTFAGRLNVDGHSLKSVGDRDAFVAMVSRDGKFLWLRSLGGVAREQATSLAINADGDRITIGGWAESSFRFAGQEYSSRGTAKDGFIATYDASGVPRWAVRYQGVGVDQVHDLAYDQDALTVLGSFSQALRFSESTAKTQGERDLFCVRYDAEGQEQWSRSWGSDKSDLGVALQIDAQGEAQLLAVVDGEIRMGDKLWPVLGKTDVLLWSLSASGDLLKSQRYGGTESFVATDAEGLVVSGYYRGQGKVAHLELPATSDERGLQLQLGPEMQLISLKALDLERLLFTRRRFGAKLRVGLSQDGVHVHFKK